MMIWFLHMMIGNINLSIYNENNLVSQKKKKQVFPYFNQSGFLSFFLGNRRRWQRTRQLDGITDSMDMSLSKLWRWWRTGKPGVLQATGSQRVGHDWVTQQYNFTFIVFKREGKNKCSALKIFQLIFTGICLIYSIMLVSAIQQSE